MGVVGSWGGPGGPAKCGDTGECGDPGGRLWCPPACAPKAGFGVALLLSSGGRDMTGFPPFAAPLRMAKPAAPTPPASARTPTAMPAAAPALTPDPDAGGGAVGHDGHVAAPAEPGAAEPLPRMSLSSSDTSLIFVVKVALLSALVTAPWYC
jgi:hypothetical protein